MVDQEECGKTLTTVDMEKLGSLRDVRKVLLRSCHEILPEADLL